uniref:Uncharacterized protein n=1 Tax=Oryza nivara TaxID=4536 RepID=A0A0E0ICR3_ORYNI
MWRLTRSTSATTGSHTHPTRSEARKPTFSQAWETASELGSVSGVVAMGVPGGGRLMRPRPRAGVAGGVGRRRSRPLVALRCGPSGTRGGGGRLSGG